MTDPVRCCEAGSALVPLVEKKKLISNGCGRRFYAERQEATAEMKMDRVTGELHPHVCRIMVTAAAELLPLHRHPVRCCISHLHESFNSIV